MRTDPIALLEYPALLLCPSRSLGPGDKKNPGMLDQLSARPAGDSERHDRRPLATYSTDLLLHTQCPSGSKASMPALHPAPCRLPTFRFRRPSVVLQGYNSKSPPHGRKFCGANVRTESTRRWFPAHRIPVPLSLYSCFICTFFCLFRGVSPLPRGFPRRLTASVGHKLC